MVNAMTIEQILSMYDFQSPQAVALLFGIAVCIAVFIWQTILVKKAKIFNGGLKKIEAAVKAGRVVNAYLTSSKTSHIDEGSTNDIYFRTYTYEVGGIRYNKTISTRHIKREQVITLYYENSPKKAKTYSQMRGTFQDFWPLLSAVVVGGSVVVILERLLGT